MIAIRKKASTEDCIRKKFLNAVAFVGMICANIKTAYAAGAIEEIVGSMVKSLFESFSGLLLGLCDFVIGPIFSITTMTVDEISAYIPGFNTGNGSGAYFSKSISIISVCIAGVLAASGIIRILYRLATGDKVESPGKFIWRICISVPLVISGQRLLSMIFDHVVSPIAQVFAKGATSFDNTSAFQDMAAPLTSDSGSLTTLIVGTVLMVMIASSLIQLILEAAERYLMCIFLIFLSPLGFSFGVSEESSQVAKNWFKMFCSHCILLVLNIWVIGIARTCFDTIDSTASPQQILVWGIITYGYIKIAQKLDDVLQNSGLLLTRTGGDFLHDMITAGATIGKAVSFGADSAALAGGAVHTKVTGGDAGAYLSEQIPKYTSRHPIAGVAVGTGVLLGTGAMAGAKGIATFADIKTADKVLNGTNESRKKLQTGESPPDFGSAAFRKAAEGRLKGSDIIKDPRMQGAVVESLRMNDDGSLTGSFIKRDTEGKVVGATAFTLSNSGEKNSSTKATQTGALYLSPDGSSASVFVADKGTYTLQKKGTDEKGCPIWSATQVAGKDGDRIDEKVPGLDPSVQFSFKPDSKDPDGELVQAAAFFKDSGKLEAMSNDNEKSMQGYAAAKQVFGLSDEQRKQAMDNGMADLNNVGAFIAAEEHLKEDPIAAEIFAGGGRVESLRANEDGTMAAVLAKRNDDGDLVQAKTFAMEGVGAIATQVQSVQYGADGHSAVIEDAKHGRYELHATGTDKYNNSLWQAARVQDNSGQSIVDRLPDSESATVDFAFRPSLHADENVAQQAVERFLSGDDISDLAQTTDNAVLAYEQLQQETENAKSMFDLTDAQRIEQLHDEQGMVNYSDEAHLNAMTDYIGTSINGEVDESVTQLIQSGGKVVSLSALEDGRLVGLAERRDESGNLVEESFFALSTSEQSSLQSEEMTDSLGKEVFMQDMHSPQESSESAIHTNVVDSVSDSLPENAGPMQTVSVAELTPVESQAEDVIVPGTVQTENFGDNGAVVIPQYEEAMPVLECPVKEDTPEHLRVQPDAVVNSCDEIHHVKYEPTNETCGIVETSDLGRVQLTRTRVDERTGESVWQIVQKRGANDEQTAEPYFAEIVRKGKKGEAEDFMSVARDMSRKARSFDQVGLLDSRTDLNERHMEKNKKKKR